MKKNKIRSNFVKDALADSLQLAQVLNENSKEAIKDLLQETVKNEFRSILSESSEDDEDDEDDVPEVSDVEDTNTEAEGDNVTDDTNTEGDEDETPSTDMENNDSDDITTDTETDTDINNDDTNTEDVNDGDEDWSEFEDFKVSDNEYDFSNAEDDSFVKVYKLLKPDDQIKIVQKDDKINIKDPENDEEYIIDMGDENNNEMNDFDDMNESTIYEVALKEYNSNTGYTDSYQHKDVMTNDGVKEPGKNVNDWDKGVPKSTSKPFGGKVKKAEPFNEEENLEDEQMNEEEENIDEANLSQSRWNDTHAVHNRIPAANKDEFRRDGMQKTSKGTQYRAHGSSEVTESVRKIVLKANDILKENKELKKAIGQFKQLVEQAAVTNMNLGNIIKIITENATTVDEKQNIIKRFAKEATSIKASNSLYEQISNELKNKTVISENKLDKQFTVNGSKKINETTLVENKDLTKVLDLMNRLKKY